MVVWLFLTTFDLFASKHANSHSLFKTHEPPPSNTMLSFTTHIFTLYVRSDLWIGLLCAQMFYKCFGACCSVSPSRISSFDSLEFWVLSHRKKESWSSVRLECDLSRPRSLKHSHHWFSDFLSHRWTSSTWVKYSLVTWTAEITSSRGRCSWWVVWQCEWGLNTS